MTSPATHLYTVLFNVFWQKRRNGLSSFSNGLFPKAVLPLLTGFNSIAQALKLAAW